MPPVTLRPSTAGLTVLSLLGAGPLHPYGMRRLIKTWGKDEVVNIGERANLYKTIKRLHETGLIAVRATERDQQYPERTVYELTEEGSRVWRGWLTDMLAAPRNEYPAFPAALSFAMMLGPGEVATVLAQRLEATRAHLARLDSSLRDGHQGLPRVTRIETEYQRAMADAEARWLEALLDDLRSGELAWGHDQLAAQAAEDYGRAGGHQDADSAPAGPA